MAGFIKKMINVTKKKHTGNIVLQKRINFVVTWKTIGFNGRFICKPTEKLHSINQ